MYPGSIFNWHDESYIQDTTTTAYDNAPLFLTVSSFDKGPEDLRVVSGQTFFDLYGTDISFKRHGQPAIQAANIINAGGSLLIKRVVAPDSTLANNIILATVKSLSVATPTTDSTGVSLDEALSGVTLVGDGEEDSGETTDPTSTDDSGSTTDDSGDSGETTTQLYIGSKEVSVSWSTVSVSGAATKEEIIAQAISLASEASSTDTVTNEDTGVVTRVNSIKVIPVFAITDNGRGESNKSIRITPDYNTSKNNTYFFYTVYVYEGTDIIERAVASLCPYATINDVNYGFDEDTSVQLNINQIEGSYDEYISAIADALDVTVESLQNKDIIFGKVSNSVAIKNFNIDAESINLNSTYGISVENGSNGSFGNAPFGTDSYNNAVAWAYYPVSDSDSLNNSLEYDYEGSDKIFDRDDYYIAAVFDANYDNSIKEAISKLVTFREDCTFFRDLGVDVASYYAIINKQASYKLHNKFIADYLTTYQIYDPSTRNRIRVTMMYDFAANMVDHFINGAYKPLAGEINSMVLPNAIEGTINFTPRITPVVNQKSLLEDARINYAIFQSGQCIVQSLYTSQEAYTQLSYVNNVLAIQEVVRAVRAACPQHRYTFVTENDFSVYADAVSSVLSNYTSHFAELGFSYEQDALKAMQKIFYAVLTFRFNNWAQTEVFDLYALPNEI